LAQTERSEKLENIKPPFLLAPQASAQRSAAERLKNFLIDLFLYETRHRDIF